MRRVACLAALATCLHAAGAPNSVEAPGNVAGVYVVGFPLRAANHLLPDAVYEMPQVDGVYLNLVWDVLAPSQERYDWRLFDREIERAVRAKKSISIGVRTGRYTPGWVVQQSGHSEFVAGPHDGATGRCEKFAVAWPWDENYQRAYGALMQAMAAHLRQTSGAYESVRIVKITGINEQTQELRLPAGRGRAKAEAGACATSDAVATWAQAGYSDAKVLAAWRRFADLTAEAFPDKVFAVEVLQANDFPRVGGGPGAGVKDAIVSDALTRWPRRFAVQWDGLSASRVSQFVEAAGRRGAIVGWQTNLFRGFDGAGCDADRFQEAKPCTDEKYRAILRNGIEHGAKYLEIWPPDALAFRDAVAEASRALHKQ